MSSTLDSLAQEIKDILGRTAQREGGYTDDPDDPGGATKYGITFATLQEWRMQPITKDDVKYLTLDEAKEIYYHKYWLPLNLDHIEDNWTKEFLFDWCINGGLKNPIRNFQRLIGAKSDAVIGPVTGRIAGEYLRRHVYPKLDIVNCRVRWYIRICVRRPTSIKYLTGWFNRAVQFQSKT